MTSTAGDARSRTRTEALGPLLSRVTWDDRWRQVEVELITGGKSNLTYLLRSPAGELILRRPPSGRGGCWPSSAASSASGTTGRRLIPRWSASWEREPVTSTRPW